MMLNRAAVICFFSLSLFSIQCYSTVTLGKYYDDIRRQSLLQPQISALSVKQFYYSQEKTSDELSVSKKKIVLAEKTGLEYNLINTYYKNGLPALTVERDGKIFQVSFAPGQLQAHVTRNILSKFGYPVRQSIQVKKLKLKLGSFDELHLPKFWNKASIALPFDNYFLSSESSSGIKVIRRAYLEEIVVTPTAVVASTDLKSAALMNPQLLITLMWFQCDNITADTESIQYCLGNSPTSSSPNFFANHWLELNSEQRGVLKNYIQDDELRKLALNLKVRDYVDFFIHAVRTPWEDIVSIFITAGFPKPLASLYVAKFKARLATLASILFRDNPLKSGGDVQLIQDFPYIINGELQRSYPGIDIESTKFNYVLLMQHFIQESLSSLDSAAQFILATMPYAGGEVAQFGKVVISPGFIFRIKREIAENFNPTGKNDLYLVKDSIEFMLCLGVGIDIERKIVSSYANISPGYIKNFIYIRPASSLAQAKSSYWSIPKDVLLEANFENLKFGETLAIQSGWAASILVGASIYAGIPKTKPRGYLMDTIQSVSAFQVAKKPNGKLIVFASNDFKNTFSIKLFSSLLSKYIRIPFSQFAHTNGRGEQQIYEIDLQNNIPWSEEKKNGLVSTLQSGSPDELKKYFVAEVLKTDYSWTNWFLNIYFFALNGASNKTAIEYTQESKSPKLYKLVSSRNMVSIEKNEQEDSCDFSGIVQTETQNSKTAKDSAVIFRCLFKTALSSAEKLDKKIQAISVMFNLTNIESAKLFQDIKASQSTSSQILISGAFTHQDLAGLLNRLMSQQEIQNLLKEFQISSDFKIQSSDDILKRRENFAVSSQLVIALRKSSAADRLMKLTQLLSRPHVEDVFKIKFISKMKNANYRIEFIHPQSGDLFMGPTVIEKGVTSSSESLNFLRERVIFHRKNLFDLL